MANELQVFEDRPMNYDAWDIDIFFEDRTAKVEGVESLTVIEQGSLTEKPAVPIAKSIPPNDGFDAFALNTPFLNAVCQSARE